MRFVQAPESTAQRQAEAALAALHRAGLDSSTTGPLAGHARIILDLLPRVDQELRDIVAMPVAARVEALQQALLQSSNSAEARAQRFRLMLYASALVLLVYLVYVFARLRGKATELRRKEMQLIQANKMTALGVLVSSVAHEINNPNQVVLTNAGVLGAAWADIADVLDGCRETTGGATVAGLPYAEMREILPRLVRESEESARRIDRIVGDLKNFARPTGRVSDIFQLNDVVQRALRLLDLLHPEADRRVPRAAGRFAAPPARQPAAGRTGGREPGHERARIAAGQACRCHRDHGPRRRARARSCSPSATKASACRETTSPASAKRSSRRRPQPGARDWASRSPRRSCGSIAGI